MSDLPIGTIIMFSGKHIPDGWLLCDGNNNTPNLINKFILGGVFEDLNAQGGPAMTGDNNLRSSLRDTSQTVIKAQGKVGEHALTLEEIPSHSHQQGELYDYDYGFAHGNWFTSSPGHWINGGTVANNTSPRYSPITNTTGDNKPHQHDLNIDVNSHDHQVNVVPPYYTLVFLIYLG
ncbi:tail fiber protein [Rahnella laticis]|uniref:tail fiber protein n=1 Tax=Rahnella laticis TaxID=2787622 RepID=UPI0018A2E3B0|nr:tail fiber protein [Rahnella laticis]MBF7997515.1 tail fiber protein [Rahnella laticis]